VAEALGVDLAAEPARPRELLVSPESVDRGLTFREQEILVLLCQRLTDAEIAERLFLSRRTVEAHVSHILQKLEEPNRRAAAAAAVRRGLI
jgi:DNA-binding NarL/FixJ family response regulator